METYFTRYDVKRLELYAQNMVDYHLIVDLLPSISRLFFLNQMDIQLSIVQSVSQIIDSQDTVNFLKLREYLIQRYRCFVSNRENIKSQALSSLPYFLLLSSLKK